MKKWLVFLGLLISLVLDIAVEVWALEFTYGGAFRVRPRWTTNPDFNDDVDDDQTLYDARFDVIFTAKTENVRGVMHLRMLTDNVLGNPGDRRDFPPTTTVGVFANFPGRGFGGETINTSTEEAYFVIDFPKTPISAWVGIWDLDLGLRHLVVGYINGPHLRADINLEKLKLFGFVSKLQEGSVGIDNDDDMWGVNVAYSVNPNLAIGGYWILNHNKTGIGGASVFGTFSTPIGKSGDTRVAGPPGTISPTSGLPTFPNGATGTTEDPNFFGFYGGEEITLNWFAVNVVGKRGIFDYSGEFVYGFGDLDDSFRGDMDLGGFAFHTIESVRINPRVTVGFNFLYASGDDPKTRDDNEELPVINPDYDVLGHYFDANLTKGGDLHGNAANTIMLRPFVNFTPIPERPLLIGATYAYLRAVEDHFIGPLSGRVFDGTEDKYIGSELDITAAYQVTPNMTAYGGLFFLWPGEYLTGKASVDPVNAPDDLSFTLAARIDYNF